MVFLLIHHTVSLLHHTLATDTISANSWSLYPQVSLAAVCIVCRVSTGAYFMESPKYMSKVPDTRLPMDSGRCIWPYMQGDQ